ncbi:MAG TPA: M56 family metallopeptidase [Longimicrobiales bacterium]
MIILSLRIAVVVLITLALATLLRRAPAALRHSLWLSAIAGIALMPFLPALLPPLEMRIAALPLVSLPLPGVEAETVGSRAAQPSSNATAEGSAALSSLEILYGTGVLAVLGWLLLGHTALRRIVRGSHTGSDEWDALLEDEAKAAGLARRPRVQFSERSRAPLVHGVFRATIVLPFEASAWDEAQMRTVLRHELAHVARHDAFTQLFARLICAAFWFHPLIWYAARRLRAECEHACDDRVLLLGTNPSSYAECLVAIARLGRSALITPATTLTMAHPSRLEERIMQIIDERRRRSDETPLVRAAALCAAAMLVSVVSACTVTRAQSTSSAQTAPVPMVADTVIHISRPADTVHVVSQRPTSDGRTTVRDSVAVDTTIRIRKKTIGYSGVVQSKTPGRETWVELVGSGATVELRSLVAIEHREGRTFLRTPARIALSGDAAFNYRLVPVEPAGDDIQFVGGDGNSYVEGRELYLARGPGGDGAQMSGAAAALRPGIDIRIPADCTVLFYSDPPVECWTFHRTSLTPTNELMPAPTTPIIMRGTGTFRTKLPVPESQLPSVIRSLNRGA